MQRAGISVPQGSRNMSGAVARNLKSRDETETVTVEEKRQRGLAMLMDAIWHRHNPPAETGSKSGGAEPGKDYLADIW
jgi:hypothetical protein